MRFPRIALVLVCLAALSPSIAFAQQLRPDYGAVPLAFEVNAGQADPRVKFLSRGEGYGLFLTPTEAVFALESGAHRSATLRMSLVGANRRPAIEPQDMLPGKNNYFTDPNPAKWRTNVANYARVKYGAVYPGIDLVYYGNQRQLEYDFIVAPGANPKAIALRFEGADAMRLDDSGDLVLTIGGEQVVQHRPIVYQERGGRRTLVDARYVLRRGGRVVFDVAAYDRSLPLVIDPVLRYSTFIGGSGLFSSPAFSAEGVAVDSSGNAYVVGATTSSDFPTTPGAFDTAPKVSPVVYVTKFNATGTAQIYSTFFGNGFTRAEAIAVDSLGQAYIAGWAADVVGDDPVGIPIVNGFQSSLVSSFNTGFIAKFNSTGSSLLYSSYLGDNRATSIAIDNSGHAYVGGIGGVAPTAGAFSANGNGWVMKIDTAASGSASLKYATQLGGVLYPFYPDPRPFDLVLPVAVAIDASGHAYVAGTAAIQDGWPTTPGAFDSTQNDADSDDVANGDIFVMKLNPLGTGVVYFTFVGSGMWDAAGAIAVDGAGNAYVGGMTALFAGYESVASIDISAFPTTPGAYRTAPYPGNGWSQFHGVVFKLNAAGSALIYSTHLGGMVTEEVRGITIDGAGRASVVGNTNSSDFPATPDAVQTAYSGGSGASARGDIYVTTLSADGSTLEYSTFFGGSSAEIGADIASGSNGELFVVGRSFAFVGSIPPLLTPGAFDTTGPGDGILFKLGPPPPTFAELRAKVAVFSNSAGVTSGLNAKLTAAESAPNSNARAGQLNAFVNQVKAQTGKALTAEEAAILIAFAALLGQA